MKSEKVEYLVVDPEDNFLPAVAPHVLLKCSDGRESSKRGPQNAFMSFGGEFFLRNVCQYQIIVDLCKQLS